MSLVRRLIYGANTDVGKTVFSAGLVRNAVKLVPNTFYVKPLQTGATSGLQETADEHTIRKHVEPQDAPNLTSATLYAWPEPKSPHVAAAGFDPPSDATIHDRLVEQLNTFEAGLPKRANGLCVVETAGGVLSPGPNGVPQGDMYQSLACPVIVVADPKLGGISVTLANVESLVNRGYDIDAIVFMEGGSELGNVDYVSKWADDNLRDTRVVQFPSIPPDNVPLDDGFFQASEPVFREMIHRMMSSV